MCERREKLKRSRNHKLPRQEPAASAEEPRRERCRAGPGGAEPRHFPGPSRRWQVSPGGERSLRTAAPSPPAPARGGCAAHRAVPAPGATRVSPGGRDVLGRLANAGCAEGKLLLDYTTKAQGHVIKIIFYKNAMPHNRQSFGACPGPPGAWEDAIPALQWVGERSLLPLPIPAPTVLRQPDAFCLSVPGILGEAGADGPRGPHAVACSPLSRGHRLSPTPLQGVQGGGVRQTQLPSLGRNTQLNR